MKFKTLGSIALTALLGASFVGCSDSAESTSTAFYLDSAVEGIDYRASSGVSGQTRADGAFDFIAGDNVTFTLGDLVLREQQGVQAGQKIIEDNDAAIVLLQSIDADGNTSNGIQITDAVKAAVINWLAGATSIEVDPNTDYLVGMADLEAALLAEDLNETTTVSLTEAKTHLAETLTANATDGSVSYIDYNSEIRTAPASAAAAEYHTGVGYGNTLFDSAENKCQNCHNELYDTWENSMHGKSWTDPVFQSKFQDFLRTHINKIGEDKRSVVGVDGITGIVYSEAKFVGVAQTCIKCHAPGAYYAGDFNTTLELVKEGATTADLIDAVANVQSNLASPTTTYDADKPATIVAVSHTTGKLYKATYQIGHKANKEGINCAFCHSMETPRLMGLGNDGDTYTLKDHIRVGPHGPAKAAAGSTLSYNGDATDPDMNKFFRLWGPEKYTDYAHTPKSAIDFDINKSKDGRYTMASKDINGTNGKTHFTGGPFYGPYGVTGKANENDSDETNRTAQINPHFDTATNNHFGNSGKSLCLSCHQRSAGAAVPSGEDGAGSFMELCSTWNAVTTGGDTPTNDELSSPKCQKCHMERIEGVVLHKWAKPNERWSQADLDNHLTAEFDANDTTVASGENPVRDNWLNSHAFLGASKTGHKTSATAKIKSGFSANVSTSHDGSTLTVTTTITNKTAHMFPGAHPMRRVLSRLIVTDRDGNMIPVLSSSGLSTFGNIENNVQPMAGKTLHSSAIDPVPVNNNGSELLDFPGKTPDMNGSTVTSQKFDGTVVRIPGTDNTLSSQEIDVSTTTGTVANAAIVDSNDTSNFTRIYGHETGKKYDLDANDTTPAVFVVRPGFDSNMVESDSRLSPNETETYTTTYDISSVGGSSGVSVTYKVYYMQKGANGKFLTGTDGWLDQALSDSKKLLVTEVFSQTVEH
jgi:Cytochrome c554 and c-prime